MYIEPYLRRDAKCLVGVEGHLRLGLYKIFFPCEAGVPESTILSSTPAHLHCPTLVQYYCTIIGQYTTPPPNSRLYAIHHAILVIKITCKGQPAAGGEDRVRGVA